MATTTNTIYQGAVAPEALQLTVSAGTSGFDLTTVTAVSLVARYTTDATATWAATIQSATAATLVLSHTMQASDTAILGTVSIHAVMTVPGGTIRSEAARFYVEKL